jgi:hypothetical protein|tara:strand:- start:355 stop:915 length:561 start_codon:yes stop_codon:yes gene_type:complete
MINNFKKPDLKASRYREKRLSLLNQDVINLFKEKKPHYENIDNEVLKKIIKLYNTNLWQAAIENRDGVELPDSLGYIFIGTCAPSKTVNTNYSLSKEYGKVLQNQNWETDGNIAKIFYTNWSTKYRFKNREFWRFTASREFKRAVAKSYPENWNKYRVMKDKYKIAHLFNFDPKPSDLKDYNEFEI